MGYQTSVRDKRLAEFTDPTTNNGQLEKQVFLTEEWYLPALNEKTIGGIYHAKAGNRLN